MNKVNRIISQTVAKTTSQTVAKHPHMFNESSDSCTKYGQNKHIIESIVEPQGLH